MRKLKLQMIQKKCFLRSLLGNFLPTSAKRFLTVAGIVLSGLLLQSFSIDDGWLTFEDKPGNFKAEFPYQPLKLSNDFYYGKTKYPAGHFFCEKKLVSEKMSLEVHYFDHARFNYSQMEYDQLNLALDSTQLDFYHSQGLKLVSEAICETNGFFGREYTYASDKVPGIIRSRAYLVGNRFYILNVQGAENAATVSLVAKFFDSFSPL